MSGRGSPASPRRLDLPAALAHLGTDPLLGPLLERFPPPPAPARRTAFAALGRSILFQQLSGRAASTILRRLTAHFPGQVFPTPRQLLELSDQDFADAGVSRQKRRYLRDLARHFEDGRLEPRRFAHLSDQELQRDLTAVLGIGVWTVQMFQINRLQRPDILPVGDLGIQKGVQLLFDLDELPTPAEMEERSAPWRPWRSVACWYLWQLVDEPD